ncbi:MAG TPA: hypothetical protein VJH24_05285 [Candidatus Bilamarchaeaceae archaeon]|nr:hypothetical protein [Candidatus Bilamarchaeaceae archaeon]
MIVGGRIDEIEGKRLSDENMKGLSINITIEDVKADGENVEIAYTYTATYGDKLGHIKLKGTLLAKEDKKLVKDIKGEWEKNKKLPDSYAESVLNVVNYSGSANGTLVARVLNLSAPLIPPRIQLSPKK